MSLQAKTNQPPQCLNVEKLSRQAWGYESSWVEHHTLTLIWATVSWPVTSRVCSSWARTKSCMLATEGRKAFERRKEAPQKKKRSGDGEAGQAIAPSHMLGTLGIWIETETRPQDSPRPLPTPHPPSPHTARYRALQASPSPMSHLTRGHHCCYREDGVKKEEEAGPRTSSPPAACCVTAARPCGWLVFVPPTAVLARPLRFTQAFLPRG